ncbi:hypothetical protein B0H66DRAFT_607281 [Apodospora peruviana]|uniref:Chromo domain-containing protein n=1 Tax=Apodospora peruviana TaxID=516989 RepID=A0AAE0M055_9PEZI|nr:hypothetical protein B0H66DRAFT_607281 [Apodospora peruviana]
MSSMFTAAEMGKESDHIQGRDSGNMLPANEAAAEARPKKGPKLGTFKPPKASTNPQLSSAVATASALTKVLSNAYDGEADGGKDEDVEMTEAPSVLHNGGQDSSVQESDDVLTDISNREVANHASKNPSVYKKRLPPTKQPAHQASESGRKTQSRGSKASGSSKRDTGATGNASTPTTEGVSGSGTSSGGGGTLAAGTDSSREIAGPRGPTTRCRAAVSAVRSRAGTAAAAAAEDRHHTVGAKMSDGIHDVYTPVRYLPNPRPTEKEKNKESPTQNYQASTSEQSTNEDDNGQRPRSRSSADVNTKTHVQRKNNRRKSGKSASKKIPHDDDTYRGKKLALIDEGNDIELPRDRELPEGFKVPKDFLLPKNFKLPKDLEILKVVNPRAAHEKEMVKFRCKLNDRTPSEVIVTENRLWGSHRSEVREFWKKHGGRDEALDITPDNPDIGYYIYKVLATHTKDGGLGGDGLRDFRAEWVGYDDYPDIWYKERGLTVSEINILDVFEDEQKRLEGQVKAKGKKVKGKRVPLEEERDQERDQERDEEQDEERDENLNEDQDEHEEPPDIDIAPDNVTESIPAKGARDTKKSSSSAQVTKTNTRTYGKGGKTVNARNDDSGHGQPSVEAGPSRQAASSGPRTMYGLHRGSRGGGRQEDKKGGR